MTKLSTLEQRIMDEYGAVRGWIATHVTASLGIAFAAGSAVTRLCIWIF